MEIFLFLFLEIDLNCSFSIKVICEFMQHRQGRKLTISISVRERKHLSLYCRETFEGYPLNGAGGSLEATLTVAKNRLLDKGLKGTVVIQTTCN